MDELEGLIEAYEDCVNRGVYPAYIQYDILSLLKIVQEQQEEIRFLHKEVRKLDNRTSGLDR